MVSAAPPHGIYVPVLTFFASSSASNYDSNIPPLDVDTQIAHSLHLVKSGIQGLVILGSTGEAVHITSSERSRLLSSVRQALDKEGFQDRPIIAGTAAQSIEEVVQQLEDAKKAGAGWGLVLTPGYFAAGVQQEGIVKWFEAVADRSPIPIMVYHYPGVSNNVALPWTTMEKLAQHPNIVGCKLSHGNLDDHTLVACNPKIDHKKFATFTGLGQQLLPLLTVGGAGAIDGLAGIFPKTVVHLYNTFNSKDQDQAQKLAKMQELQFNICRGEKLVVKWGTTGIREAVSRVLGFGDADGGRLPLRGGFPGGDKEWENWKDVMDALKEIESKL